MEAASVQYLLAFIIITVVVASSGCAFKIDPTETQIKFSTL